MFSALGFNHDLTWLSSCYDQRQLLFAPQLYREKTQEIFNNINDLTLGINKYLFYSYTRKSPAASVIWHSGSTELLSYNNNDLTQDAPIILFIPSLINKHYILDLRPENSLVRFLTERNVRIFVLSWQEPTPAEFHFSSHNYITERLEQAISVLTNQFQQPIILAGYCMGGLMALAAALRCQQLVSKLILLATPWDFSSINLFPSHFINALSNFFEQFQVIPPYIIQNLFRYLDYERICQKFIKFAQMDQASKEAELFVAVEKWASDGISITSAVIKELADLCLHNNTMLNNWYINNCHINPYDCNIPTLIAAPQNDRIVPYTSSLALASFIPNHTLLTPPSGHVGMIIGRKAKKTLWEPLYEWVSQNSNNLN